MEPLASLAASLRRTLLGPSPSARTWSDPSPMASARQAVAKQHGGALIKADSRSIMASVEAFKKGGRAASFRDLKYVCLGVGLADRYGWRLLVDAELRARVAALAEGQAEPRRRMRCFQALLSAYFDFPANDEATDEDAKAGWRELRGWLGAEQARLDKLDVFKPPWFESLSRHARLLTSKPCDHLGAALMQGDASELSDARQSLSISESSWVVEEAVFAQMKAACALSDARFKPEIAGLLDIAMGRLGVSVGPPLRIRCVALLASRYARCAARPKHPELLDVAVSAIGNPWLRRANWDAWVRKDGGPDDEARQMVFGWLKERLVADFFELLSADGINERRRVDYWLRFAPMIDDMWFALGAAAKRRRGAAFQDFMSRAEGKVLDLEGTGASNNAFVMRIGDRLAIEYGEIGNALYLFRWSEIPTKLRDALLSGQPGESIRILDLKSRTRDDKLVHMDAPSQLKSWEQKFDDKISRLIEAMPASRPACVPELEKLVGDAEVKDLRDKGGALWVHDVDRASRLSRKLESMGFSFRAARGWHWE